MNRKLRHRKVGSQTRIKSGPPHAVLQSPVYGPTQKPRALEGNLWGGNACLCATELSCKFIFFQVYTSLETLHICFSLHRKCNILLCRFIFSFLYQISLTSLTTCRHEAASVFSDTESRTLRPEAFHLPMPDRRQAVGQSLQGCDSSSVYLSLKDTKTLPT